MALTSKKKKEQLNQLFAIYNKRLGRLYSDYIKRLLSLGYDEGVLDDDALFNFDNFPKLKARLNNIFNDYFQNSLLCYENGITDGVTLAYNHDKEDLGTFTILSNDALKVARATAAKTFIANRLHSKEGLNLAQTVWNYCQQSKGEFEMAMSNVLADGIKAGESAEQIGSKLRQYLNNPDMMYRRYYFKKLSEVQDAIDWANLNSMFAEVKSYKTQSKVYHKMVYDLENAINAHDKNLAEKLYADAKAEKESLINAKSKRNAKNVQFDTNAFSPARKDAAVWDTGMGEVADKALVDTAGRQWIAATETEKDYVYEYTSHYRDVNEPLQGRTYYNQQSKARFIDKVNNITSYIEKNELPTDMWFTRGDDGLSVIESRIKFAGGSMPNNLQDLVGMEMQEGGFMSTASRKGEGFSSKDVILNIYAPKGTKAAYIEPISAFGCGAERNWDGIERFTSYSSEQEALFQRGTRMRITKVYQEGSKTYIDCEVIGQELKDLSYVRDSNIGY